MTRNPWEWTREDLEKQLGQAESLRLDFKESRLFQEDRNKIVDILTKEVSAFANTEGGTIVIGIKEDRQGKTRLAAAIDDGVDRTQLSPEWLQQTIEAKVSPLLTGLRVHAIPLQDKGNNCAFVIHVPQGTTAYQASDFLYYGRSEYESKALPDYEIRLRMFRGRSGKAVVQIHDLTAEVEEWQVDKYRTILIRDLAYEDEELYNLPPDEVFRVSHFRFHVYVANVGEINISEFKARYQLLPIGIHDVNSVERDVPVKDGWTESFGFAGDTRTMPMKVNIYPMDRYRIGRESFMLRPDQTIDGVGLKLRWTLYLKDAFPTEGEIDVMECFRNVPVAPS